MKPANWGGATEVIHRPDSTSEEQCGDLAICRGHETTTGLGIKTITACFEFETEEEKQEFIRTGKIYFTNWGVTMAPIVLSAFNPVELGYIKPQ